MTAVALSATGVASAEENVKIVETPSGDVFARFYPDRAQRLEVSGTATIVCAVTDAGLLNDCTATHEWPHGFGFGEAALRLTPFFRLSGRGSGQFKTRIRFRLEDDGDLLYLQGVAPGDGDNRLPIIAKPTPEQLTAAYPGQGDVVISVGLNCTLTAEGRLGGCTPMKPDQAPEAIAAAQRMATLYRTKAPPAYLVGKPTQVGISFIPPDPGEPPAPGAPKPAR